MAVAKIPKVFFLDCETTGRSLYKDRIKGLAVQLYIPGQSMDEMQPLSILVNPEGFPIGPARSDICSTSNSELLSADYFPEAWSKVVAYIGARTDVTTDVPVIVSHNAKFNSDILRCEFDRHDIPHPENLRLCSSVGLARTFWPGKSTDLAVLAKKSFAYDISTDALYRANQNVKFLAAVVNRMNAFSLKNSNVPIEKIIYSCSGPLLNFIYNSRIPDAVQYSMDMVLAGGDALLSLYLTLEERYEAQRSLLALLLESKMHVHRICGSIDRNSSGINKISIPGIALWRVGQVFKDILCNLKPAIGDRVVAMETFRLWNEELRALEDHLREFGLMKKSLRDQLQEVTEAVLNLDASLYGHEISGILESIGLTLKKDAGGHLGRADAKNLLDALSTIELPENKKAEISNLAGAGTVSESWKVNFDDVQFIRKQNGDRQCIGKSAAADLYLASMKVRSVTGLLIPGDPIEVTVKLFRLKPSGGKEKFELFVRDVFLRKSVHHPCIVRTFGGYWPQHVETDIMEPFIVMERMTHNLRQAQEDQLLSLESKIRVLMDIADGIEHLHNRCIVHWDIKPENVLMQIVDGQIDGRAKLSDFSDSRIALQADVMTTALTTTPSPTGTSAYIPPEAINDSIQEASGSARDIWSFGILMCDVLMPNFLANVVTEHPEGLHALAITGQLAEMVVETAKHSSIDQGFADLAVSCLSLDPRLRPGMKEVSVKLKEVSSKFWQFRKGRFWKDLPASNPYFQEVIIFIQRCDEVDLVPEQARQLLNALSKSGIPNAIKLELSDKARKIWEGWKVNYTDIEFTRKRNGNRKIIGDGASGKVYLGQMKLRDENGDIIPGEHMEVAVKQFTVPRSNAKMDFHPFMREVYLQKLAQHPCIVKTLGGYWPDPDELDEEDDFIEPCIVMERMTYNLVQAQENELLVSLDSKRRVLGDVAAGIAHLHARDIVHRDIKPENVLMRVIDGEIIGRAKVCDFGVSRKAEEAEMMACTMRKVTRPTGTSLYMPPEAFRSSVDDACQTARDIWSFGVLICEVLVPEFLANLVRNHPEGVDIITRNGQFAEEVAESVRNISCHGSLGELAVSCLSLDPKLRPRIAEVSDQISEFY